MKIRKKALILSLCAIVLVITSMFGTIAYLVDDDTVVNTFTVGAVGLKLDEAKVNKDGSYVTNAENRGIGNEYKLIPGHTYIKDPMVHVDADSEDCYIFIKVENGIADIEAANETDVYRNIAEQIKANGWTAFDNKPGMYYREFYKGATQLDYLVFDKFKIDGDKVVNAPEVGKYSIADYSNAVIEVTAYAVQKAGFRDNVEDAWAALDIE